MDKLQVFNRENFDSLPKEEDRFFGRFYALEFGGYVKIGSSKKVRGRMKSLLGTAKYGEKDVGSVVISSPHTNYKENEKQLHTFFKQKRVEGTELFDISLKDFACAAKKLSYKDESLEKEENLQASALFMKKYFFGV